MNLLNKVTFAFVAFVILSYLVFANPDNDSNCHKYSGFMENNEIFLRENSRMFDFYSNKLKDVEEKKKQNKESELFFREQMTKYNTENILRRELQGLAQE